MNIYGHIDIWPIFKTSVGITKEEKVVEIIGDWKSKGNIYQNAYFPDALAHF